MSWRDEREKQLAEKVAKFQREYGAMRDKELVQKVSKLTEEHNPGVRERLTSLFSRPNQAEQKTPLQPSGPSVLSPDSVSIHPKHDSVSIHPKHDSVTINPKYRPNKPLPATPSLRNPPSKGFENIDTKAPDSVPLENPPTKFKLGEESVERLPPKSNLQESGPKTLNNETLKEIAKVGGPATLASALGPLAGIYAAVTGVSTAAGKVRDILKPVPVLGRGIDVAKDLFDYSFNPATGGVFGLPITAPYRLAREGLDIAGKLSKEKGRFDAAVDPVTIAENLAKPFEKPKETKARGRMVTIKEPNPLDSHYIGKRRTEKQIKELGERSKRARN